MNTLQLCIVLACVAWHASGQDGESRPAVQRGLLKRGLLAKGKQTTTTSTTPAPQQQDYDYEQEYETAEVDAVPTEVTSEAPPSSTESKKLVGSGVRPFRSNTDLLEALKRRRVQAAEAKHHVGQLSTSTSTELAPITQAPSKNNINGKKRFTASSRGENVNEDSAAPTPSKPNRNRFNRPAARSIQSEPEAEEQNEAAQTRSSRTFTRRGGN